MKSFNENLLKTIRLTREMLALADEGDRDRNDDSCGIIYGVMRDAAYRIRKHAMEECDKHKKSGKWDEHKTGNTNKTENKESENKEEGDNQCQV